MIGQITHTRRSDGAPESNGVLQIVTSDKKHHRQNYLNQPDPTVFIPVVVDTSGLIYSDFSRLLFFVYYRLLLFIKNR